MVQIILVLLVLLCSLTSAFADKRKYSVNVGVATVLSGDLAVIGSNIQKTVITYHKHHLRHSVRFTFEDAKKSSVDGLAAYKRLIDVSKVDLLIGGTTSNGTMAAAPIVNKSKKVLITPLTGGSNIDKAGEYIFRIGNSDILNGYQQADLLLARGLNRVALITEQTEYTSDMAKFFKERFTSKGGVLSTESDFLPDSNDFRTMISKIKASKPQAIFMSTQSGLAFGLFIKQFRQLSIDSALEIHTNFLSADNPDARAAAGESIFGVHYLAPAYDKTNPRLIKFFADFKADHGEDPAIAFHSAGTVDALDMLQAYLDQGNGFDSEKFHEYLLKSVQNYKGLMGIYSFDTEGNANIGFEPRIIEKIKIAKKK